MLRVEGITKLYRSNVNYCAALSNVTLTLDKGEMCALTGSSGSGKTTLMNIIGLLDRPDAGFVNIAGRQIASLPDDNITQIRNELIGFVFQSFHLLPRLNALENVALPLLYRGVPAMQRRKAAATALERVGLSARLAHLPDELSGGQRQRVAVARALVGSPSLLLADEPTGNLDGHSSDEIITLLLSLNRDTAMTILIVTHDPTVAARCPRRVVMQDGRILRDNSAEIRSNKDLQ